MLRLKRMAVCLCMVLCMLLYGCGAEEDEKPSNLPEIKRSHVTYYRDADGNIFTEDELKQMESPGSETSETENSFLPGTDIKFELQSVEMKRNDNGLYQMLAYAELTTGFDFDFENMNIGGIPYYNDNYEEDHRFVDASYTRISDGSEDTERYLVTFSCSEEFNLADVNLQAYNLSNNDFDADLVVEYSILGMESIDFHRTYSSPIHFIEVNGHYYVWDQSVYKQYLPCDDEAISRVAIVPDTVLWTSEGGSVEELFTVIAENSKWANELNGEPFDTEYAQLTVEEIDGYGLCLVKTAKVNLDDEKSDPCYIAFTEPGHSTMYFVIV